MCVCVRERESTQSPCIQVVICQDVVFFACFALTIESSSGQGSCCLHSERAFAVTILLSPSLLTGLGFFFLFGPFERWA
jgi:hypothetical protein